MESSKYFNSHQYSALKAKDDTLPMVRKIPSRKVEGGPKRGMIKRTKMVTVRI